MNTRRKVNRAVVVVGLVIVVLLWLLAISFGGQSISAGEDGNSLVRAEISFSSPVTVAEALDSLKGQEVQVTQLQHRFPVGKQTYTDMLPVHGGEDAEQLSRNLEESRAAFWADTANDLQRMLEDKNGSPLTKKLATNQLAAQEKAAKETNSLVDRALVVGSVKAIKNLRLPSGWSVRSLGAESLSPSGKEKVAYPAPPTATPYWGQENWVPECGYSFVYPSYYGGRYTTQYMWWDDVSGFAWDSTYEHDFFLNNYDGRTYLDAGQDWWGFPYVTYAASSLPDPYLDTRLEDPNSEKAYTIGCASADYIQSWTDYWHLNYIRTNNGNARRDTSKLIAQKGHRWPSWCYSTWCSYGDPPRIWVIEAWVAPVPGSWYWVW